KPVAVERLKMLSALYAMASEGGNLVASSLGTLQHGKQQLEFPRFTFTGPRGGGDPIRFGLFAGIHGDEPAGVLALIRLIEHLVAQPELGAGYRLFFYPACNPTGLVTGTRLSAAGKDLNREV